MRNESIEYYRLNSPKNEINHKTRIPQPDHTFQDGCMINKKSPRERKQKRKILEKDIIGTSLCTERPTWKKQFPFEKQKNGDITGHLNNTYYPETPARHLINGMEKTRVRNIKII